MRFDIEQILKTYQEKCQIIELDRRHTIEDAKFKAVHQVKTDLSTLRPQDDTYYESYFRNMFEESQEIETTINEQTKARLHDETIKFIERLSFALAENNDQEQDIAISDLIMDAAIKQFESVMGINEIELNEEVVSTVDLENLLSEIKNSI